MEEAVSLYLETTYDHMQVIRQYMVPENGVLTIQVPKAFDGQQVEVQLILADEVAVAPSRKSPKQTKPTTGLEKLVGKYKHFTPAQNEKIDHDLTAMRDEWERSI